MRDARGTQHLAVQLHIRGRASAAAPPLSVLELGLVPQYLLVDVREAAHQHVKPAVHVHKQVGHLRQQSSDG